jgi:hypothetical protein
MVSRDWEEEGEGSNALGHEFLYGVRKIFQNSIAWMVYQLQSIATSIEFKYMAYKLHLCRAV